MNKSFTTALIAVAAVAAGTALSSAGVVEEETWYNASGEVVKKVKRTYTGAEANRSPDWEPAWVLRERRAASRVVRYSSPRSRWGGTCYTSPFYFHPASWYGAGCYRATPRRSGFTGFYRSGGSGSGWGLSFRSRGLSIGYCD